jgi:hypothetical protein
MAKRLSQQRWIELIGEFEQSEETQAAFARRHRLRVTTFQKWLYRLRRELPEQPMRFVEVRADEAPVASAMEITVGNTVTLKLSSRVPRHEVVDLVVDVRGGRSPHRG